MQLTGVSGAVMRICYYDAFGNMLMEYMDDTNPFRYCGEYWDDETRNYYLRARYYSPSTGRFTQRDSYLGRYADPLSLNRYTYGHNNPVRYRDPSGHVVTGVNFGPNEGADWLRTGSGLSFEEYWGVGPYGAPISTPSAPATGNNGVNFGPNEGADWLRTGSGLSFEEYWGVGPYGTPLGGSSPSVAYSYSSNVAPDPQPNLPPDAFSPPKSSGNVEIVINGTVINNTMNINGSAWGNANQIARQLGIKFNTRDYDYYLASNGVYIARVNDLIKAAGLGDCMSWWNDSLGMHVTVNEDLKNAPVKMIRSGNEIKITGYVVFTGRYEDTYSNTSTSYAQLAIDGMEHFWSSSTNGETYTINGQTVTVETKLYDITNDPSSHAYFTIDIQNNDPGRNSWGHADVGGWSISSVKTVHLYKQYFVDDYAALGVAPYEYFSEDYFRRIAAHEFGHILGIDDAYPGGNRPDAGPDELKLVSYDDMMRYQYDIPSPLSGWDIAMALQAVTENKWQFWGKYNGNTASKIIGLWKCSQ